jgi:hypothetical protein
METGFYPIVKLVGFQLSNGDAAQELSERVLAQAEENLGKLHNKPA